MNKTVDLRKNTTILFILNICILLSLVLFKFYFTKIGYYKTLVNAMFAINLILLIIGIIFNVILIKKHGVYNERKSLIIIVTIFIIYLLMNTIGVVVINKPLSNRYAKIANRLSKYCDSYTCDRYETISKNGINDFIIKKIYLDYNGTSNDIEIHTKYDSKDIISVKAIIYSQNEMFSEMLIKEQVNGYYQNFNVKIEEDMIKKAFDNRFSGNVKKDNITYKVDEVYENKELVGLKTTIILNLKQV